MTPAEKRAQIEAVIAHFEAEGQPINNAAIYREVGGNRTNFLVTMRDWRAQRRDASAVAILEASTHADANGHASPASAPQPLLTQLAHERTQLQRALEAVQQRVLANAHAMHEAQRQGRTVLERLRQASRVARVAPRHEVQAACAQVRATERALAQFVGEEEARRAANDLAYVPRGL